MPSPYPRLARAGFDRYARYGAASLAGLFTNTVFGLLRLSILSAPPVLAAAATTRSGYDAAATATYVWLGQGLLTVVQFWTDGELDERVRTGHVVIDLSRPWDLQAALLATDLGRAGHAVLFRLVPPVLIGAVFFPFRWPHHPLTWACFAVSVLLAVVTSMQIRFLISLTTFWLLDSRGVRSMWVIVSGVLSGLVVPLAYFPDRIRTILELSPFPVIMQAPIDVFSERGAVAVLLLRQLAWALALSVLARLTLSRATRRLVVQGG